MYLITGSNGYIGSVLVSRLKRDSHRIRHIFKSQPKGDYLTDDFLICNLGFEEIPSNVFADVNCVIHLAGISSDVSSTKNDADIYDKVNHLATLELAQKASQNGVKVFIFVSSVKAGGDSEKYICKNEEDQNQPLGIYARSKRDAEEDLIRLSKTSEMKIIIIRPALVYGPGVKGNLENLKKMVLKSWVPSLPEVGNRRSLVHLHDVVSSIMFLQKSSCKSGEIFNVTDGNNYSTRQLCESIASAYSKKLSFIVIPTFVFSVMRKLHMKLDFIIDKLLGDECYSSEKLFGIGFKPEFSIWHKNAWK